MLTAIGEKCLLAKQISRNGKPAPLGENLWKLSCRDWEKVA
jgi:hypothetical protein